MSIIDTHCHLTTAALYKDLPDVLRRARQADVSAIITVATDAADSCQTVAVADHYDGVHATVGIHPHMAAKVAPGDFDVLRELRHNPNVVAWGEIGLDYFYDFSDEQSQKDVFVKQLELAKRAELPVIIHCRDAAADVFAMLDEHDYRDRSVVFHCFTGSPDEAKHILDHGWWLSFTGIVTFKNSTDLQAIAKDYPLDKLMLETDAPYLAPQPHRKVKPNQPHLLVHTAEFLADLKGLALDQLVTATSQNATRFFGL